MTDVRMVSQQTNADEFYYKTLKFKRHGIFAYGFKIDVFHYNEDLVLI